MRNDSVVRAFEQLTGVNVARSNMPEMMGAYGCALFMREEMKGKIDQGNTARNIEELLSMSEYETRQLQCHGCETVAWYRDTLSLEARNSILATNARECSTTKGKER